MPLHEIHEARLRDAVVSSTQLPTGALQCNKQYSNQHTTAKYSDSVRQDSETAQRLAESKLKQGRLAEALLWEQSSID